MSTLRSDSPIQYVKGVGPQRARHFASLNIETVGDLLNYFPFRHEYNQGAVEIIDLQPGAPATVRGEVIDVRLPGRRGDQLLATLHDGTAECVLRWFTAPPYDTKLRRGAMVLASGPVRDYAGKAEMVQPHIRVYPPNAVIDPADEGARLVGVYRGNEQLKTWAIRQTIERILNEADLLVEEIVPAELRQRRRLPSREAAIRGVHLPKDEKALEQARRRLAYDEFLLLELAMALRRQKNTEFLHARKLIVNDEIDRRIRARFPFPLTASQDEVLADIRRDLASGHPMTRLLQGDVGSGKTVVALYACLASVAHHRQSAIMAPTEILAEQHFANIEKYLAGSQVRRVLLTGSRSARERAAALQAIEAGEIDLVVGTQSLIQRDVAFRDLALIVVDEQHKFGVLQRAVFRTKGAVPHFLIMTATPIPRTLAMTVFGDLDVSIIRHSPPGRGRIVTKVVTPAQLDKVLTYARERLEAGEQAYVVCPLIGEESEEESTAKGGGTQLAQVEKTAERVSVHVAMERLSAGSWKGLKLAVVHGGMKTAEKQAVIDAFRRGELQALIATTVVEVGVDVPNATIMLIENADGFGLSQLHQLRGRVGRGGKDSLCVLIARTRGLKSRERLAVMAQTNDGFRIAEADLKQRGPGELLGTRQHGLPELKVGDLSADFSLLDEAREDAFALIARDPTLKKPDHAPLAAALRYMFRDMLALIDAG